MRGFAIIGTNTDQVLRLAVQQRDEARRRQARYLGLIRHARENGATVSEIAAALGVSKQAVSQQLRRRAQP